MSGYKLVQKNNDTAMLIREDVKINKVIEEDIGVSNVTVSIDTEEGEVTIINIYARDGMLRREDLKKLEKKRKTIIVGDLNAKHESIIPHTQKVKYNKNGIELLKHMEGEGQEEPSSWTIHNIVTDTEYTHTSAKGDGWCQIDYIISSADLTHLMGQFMYLDELHSDHKGIAIDCIRMLTPVYKGKAYKETWDWKTFNKLKYQSITEAELAQVTKEKESSIEGRISRVTKIMQSAFEASTKKKKK